MARVKPSKEWLTLKAHVHDFYVGPCEAHETGFVAGTDGLTARRGSAGRTTAMSGCIRQPMADLLETSHVA